MVEAVYSDGVFCEEVGAEGMCGAFDDLSGAGNDDQVRQFIDNLNVTKKMMQDFTDQWDKPTVVWGVSEKGSTDDNESDETAVIASTRNNK